MTNVIPESRISIALKDYLLDSGVAVTGSGWAGGLTDLATNTFADKATASSTDTTIALDLGTSSLVDVISIPQHTLGVLSTGRVRLSNNVLLLTDPGAVPSEELLYDTGVVLTWPDTSDLLDIPHDEYVSWAGTFTGYHPPPLYLTKINTVARYLYIDLSDPASSSYTLSKITVGPNWLPTGGVSAGWTDKLTQKIKTHTRLPGGGVFVEDKANTRQIQFKLGTLTEAEIFNQATIIDKQLTKKTPYIVIVDPSDTTNSSRLFIYGANSKTTPAKHIQHGFYSKTFIIDEWA